MYITTYLLKKITQFLHTLAYAALSTEIFSYSLDILKNCFDYTYLFFTHLCFCRVYTPFHDQTTDTGTKIWQSMANAFILLGVIVVMTLVLLALYKYECYKVSVNVAEYECLLYEWQK